MMETEGVTMESPQQSAALVYRVFQGCADFHQRESFHAAQRSLYPPPPTPVTESIVQGEVLMMSGNLSDVGSGQDTGTPVINTYNGAAPSQLANPEAARRELEEKTIFVGVAVYNHKFSDAGKSVRAIAAQYGGVATMLNTGTIPIRPGEFVCIAPPKIDFSDCSRLPASAGPPTESKVRPVTKPFTLDLPGILREELCTPPRKSKIGAAPAVDMLAKKHVQDRDRAFWRGLAAINSVGACMVDFVEDLLLERYGVAMDAAGRALGPLLFAGRLKAGAMTSLLCGSPWVERLPTVSVAGREVNFSDVRDKVVAEWQKRLKEPGAAFGTGDPDPMTGGTGTNAFCKPKVASRSATVRVNTWDKKQVEYASAVAAVENVPELLTIPLRAQLHTAMNRVVGRVLKGGAPGVAMDVVLMGSGIML